MDWLTGDVIDKLMQIPYLLALAGVCVFKDNHGAD